MSGYDLVYYLQQGSIVLSGVLMFNYKNKIIIYDPQSILKNKHYDTGPKPWKNDAHWIWMTLSNIRALSKREHSIKVWPVQ